MRRCRRWDAMRTLRRRISRNAGERVSLDQGKSARKLVELVERAQSNGLDQGPLTPVEALVTIEGEDWVWQIVDHEVLELSLIHI